MAVKEVVHAGRGGYLNTSDHHWHHLNGSEIVKVEEREDGSTVITRADWSQQTTYGPGMAVTIVRHL